MVLNRDLRASNDANLVCPNKNHYGGKNIICGHGNSNDHTRQRRGSEWRHAWTTRKMRLRNGNERLTKGFEVVYACHMFPFYPLDTLDGYLERRMSVTRVSEAKTQERRNFLQGSHVRTYFGDLQPGRNHQNTS